MGFFTGRMTCTRFKVSGERPTFFGPWALEKLMDNQIGTQRVATADGSQFGWIAGDNILDVRWDLAKNVVSDCLSFAIRLDTNKPPADLLKAYYEVEVAALASQNPSGFPSGRQKREARAVAKDRLEQEAKDGRFIRRRMIPLLWDSQTGQLLIGTESANAINRVRLLFKQTFERTLELRSAGEFAIASSAETADAIPTVFVQGGREEVSWALDEQNRDWLGNEFIVWLWHHVERESDTLTLRGDSEVAVMFARSITLECPRGQYGSDTFRSDGPTKLPETFRALRAGRLPRKCGLTLHRHDCLYELTLQAETFAIGSAKLPPTDAENERARQEERVHQVREMLMTVDMLYDKFLEERLDDDDWKRTLERIKRWLGEQSTNGESLKDAVGAAFSEAGILEE